jgi:hypothetical protein
VNRLIAAGMPERDLEEHIRRMCDQLGVWRWHVPDSSRMQAGLPDDILLGPNGLLWRENKSMTGRLTPEQRTVGNLLRMNGQNWSLWTPADLVSGRIGTELAAIAAHPQLPLEGIA